MTQTATLNPGRNPGTIQERYRRYAVCREPFLEEARRCAALTIPSLCPPSGLSNGAKLYEPVQSLGAHGLKNLAEKILMVMFPPGRPFFRLSVSKFDLDHMVSELAMAMVEQQGQQPDPETFRNFVDQMRREATLEVERNLASSEQAITRDFEIENNRPTDSEAVKHLLNNGSVLRYCPQNKTEQPRIYDLNHHVIKREPDGNVLEMITWDSVTSLSVPEDVREACGLDDDPVNRFDKKYDLYTQILRGETRWEVVQELNGVEVPESRGSYPLDECPWIPLRWTKIDGEDYGRSFVSDYRGSLRALEGLTQAILDNSAAAARLLTFVNPNSQYGTRLRDVARAENGAVLPGNASDVTFLRVEKHNDLSVALQQIQNLERNLSQAFLLNSSVRRDAERVTAQEISVLAQELQIGLGGSYSTVGKEYQRPLLQNKMAQMRKAGSLPDLPAEVTPTIITGVDAMGRSADLEKLVQYGQFLMMFPPDVVRESLRFYDIFKQGAAAVGIEADAILKSEQEVEAERQQQMQMALAQQAIGPAINAGAQGAAAQPVQQ